MPTLGGRVVAAPSGAHGFDSASVLSAQTARAMNQSGFQFCIRYLSRLSPQGRGDLSNTEAKGILDGGLALMAVQHVSKPGWVPNATLGRQYGQGAVANAQSVGLPTGLNVWLDLEGINPSVSHDDVIQYCNTWFDEVAGAGYETGVYVGYRCILSPDELFWRLKTTHYWRSGSQVPDIPQRGYQLVQHIGAGPDIVNGVEIASEEM
jgi:hypothetical protein